MLDDQVSWGLIPTGGRDSLPFALIHGESLVATATWALEASEVTPLGHGVRASWLANLEEAFVLHDPLCPMTPPDFIAECVAEALADEVIVAAFRPVTDTIKVLDGDFIGGTVDREQLLALTSPVVVPPSRLGELPDLDYDAVYPVQLVATLSGVRFKEAPVLGARVQTDSDLVMLEAISQPTGHWPDPDPQPR